MQALPRFVLKQRFDDLSWCSSVVPGGLEESSVIVLEALLPIKGAMGPGGMPIGCPVLYPTMSSRSLRLPFCHSIGDVTNFLGLALARLYPNANRTLMFRHVAR